MKIKSDEFVVSEEFGWMHLDDGEGTTRISMPKDVWTDLCKKTLEQKTQTDEDINVEFIDYEICGDYWKVMQGTRELGIVYESEGWAAETSTGMSWDMIDTKEDAIQLVVDESEDVCSLCGR